MVEMLLKNVIEDTSEKDSIDWTNYVQEIVILLAMTSWRQWPKNTWQGKTNPLNLSPGFSKYPHVGYQTSSFSKRISMELFNFKNSFKKSFKFSRKIRLAHKNIVSNQCDQWLLRNSIFGVFVVVERHHNQKKSSFLAEYKRTCLWKLCFVRQRKEKTKVRLLVTV